MAFRYNPFTSTLDIVNPTTPPVVSASESISAPIKNNSGSAINIYQPVVMNATGGMSAIDVSTFTQKRVMGISAANTSDNSFGSVILSGRIESITTPYSVGDTIYVSKIGTLTNIIPEIGVGGFVAGDAMIKIGNLVINDVSPSDIDLLVDVELIALL